jgi:hypothetical protein
MRTTLLLLALLATPALASQTVWKWTDEKGVTHYSDRSVPGATPMVLGRGNAASSAATSNSSAAAQAQPQDNAGPAYTDFEIWQPANEEALINTAGLVTVNIRLTPSLQSAHSVFLYLDGRLVDGFPGNTLSFELKEVSRGLHTLLAVVVDTSGQKVQETPMLRFTVRQESIAQPPVGPGLRPPPKPTRQGGASAKLPSSQPTYAALNAVPAPIDPVTNKRVVAKPAPAPAGPRQGN